MSTPTPVPYDFNFCFPVRELESDRIKLIPFIPSVHADLYFQGSSSHPELYKHHTFGPYPSAAAFTQHFVDNRTQPDSGRMLYAILDKTRSPPTSDGTNTSPSSADFAGIAGYTFGSPDNLSVEIGSVIVLPPFQRTHVTTHVVGSLLQYALNLPTASPPGLGLRRVQWETFEQNEASIKVAERMGLQKEARLRWDRIFQGGQGKVGNGENIREGDPRPGTLGGHIVMYAMCWDDWENGWRERVARVMDR